MLQKHSIDFYTLQKKKLKCHDVEREYIHKIGKIIWIKKIKRCKFIIYRPIHFIWAAGPSNKQFYWKHSDSEKEFPKVFSLISSFLVKEYNSSLKKTSPKVWSLVELISPSLLPLWI